MEFEDLFYRIWNNLPFLEIKEHPEIICEFAKSFRDWTNELIKNIDKSNIVSVNQAKLLLQDKYYEWQHYVPTVRRHKRGLKGHVCIYQVYEIAYERLKILELSLTPPLIFLPESPIFPPPPRIAGIFLGEEPLNTPEGGNDNP